MSNAGSVVAESPNTLKVRSQPAQDRSGPRGLARETQRSGRNGLGPPLPRLPETGWLWLVWPQEGRKVLECLSGHRTLAQRFRGNTCNNHNILITVMQVFSEGKRPGTRPGRTTAQREHIHTYIYILRQVAHNVKKLLQPERVPTAADTK